MPRGGRRNNAGRKALPKALHDLQGTKPRVLKVGDQVLLKAENIQCPEWFQGNIVAVETWEWALKVLEENNLLTSADLMIVEQMSLTYAAVRGLWVRLGEGESVEMKISPLLTQLRQFSAVLGLDPANRARIPGKTGDPEDGFGSFLE